MMKQKQQSKRRRHVGLPIPSFATSQDETIMTSFAVDILIATEAAVRTYLVPRKRNYLNVRKEWNTIANGVLLVHHSTKGSYHHQHYSKQSLLLIDLLTAASPSLYTLEGDVLTMTINCESRISELRRLAAVQTVLVTKRKAIEQQVLQLLVLPKEKSHAALMTTEVQKTNKLSLDEILRGAGSPVAADDCNETSLTTTTTLMERVAARAKAKHDMQQKQQLEHQLKGDMASNHMLLRVADALWSHSRHVLLRQARLASSFKRHPSTCMVMTVKDVCGLLSPGSKKDIVEALLELQGRAPTWIVCSTRPITKQTSVWIHAIQDYQTLRATLGERQSVSTGACDKKPMSKSTSETATATNDKKPEASPRVEPTTESDKPMVATPTAAATLPTAPTTNPLALKRKGSKTCDDARRLDSILGKVQKTAATLLKPTTLKSDPGRPGSSNNNDTSGSASWTPQRNPGITRGKPIDNTITSTNKGELAVAARKGSSTSTKITPAGPIATSTGRTVPPPPINQKRKAASTESPPPRKKKRTNMLRINHNLIHTDADYDGGEVLEIDQISSPRGLKRLFLQMNAGQRI